MPVVRVKPRFCTRCGEEGPFATTRKTRCAACDVLAEDDKKESNKPYHAARYKAWRKLQGRHPEEFDMYFKQELVKARKKAQ